ncbi:lipopolysaccharide assembly LapA domain-containing protein [Tessaracoccus sp. MC1627]|uniref:LapA family protein n=1 Tax=Tessaracoccus sp. MC1627 TaxID=2760312 RepID=UPI00351CA40F
MVRTDRRCCCAHLPARLRSTEHAPTELTFWAWTFTSPVGVAMLFAAIAGALVTAMVGTARMIVLGRTVRSLEHERDKNH